MNTKKISSEIQLACQNLIDAAAHDMEVFVELEKTNTLFNGYNPKMRLVHEQNAQLLEEFIMQYGWPLPLTFGKDVHEAAWLIAIHAISKPGMLKSTLQLLEQALQAGQPVAEEYAKLFDRIALYEGRKQYYGTQFFPSPMGWIARDLLDPENVDERRALLGLSTFLEGKQACGAVQGGIIDETEMERYNTDFLIFLKDSGWRL
jgi:hypothetical protein